MKRSALVRVAVLSYLIAFQACSHAPIGALSDPKTLLEAACGFPAELRPVKGSVWMKASSKDASGQFPAVVEATPPDGLKLEVTNLLGATQALIEIRGHKYTVTSPQKKKVDAGSGSWGGIPLQWASDLFLGKVPCPPSARKKDLLLSVSVDGDLEVVQPASLSGDEERFVYHYRLRDGHPWPMALHWGRAGSAPRSVDFKFGDPDDSTHVPKKWEAKSAQGEVKVRWRDREVLPR